MVDSPSIITYHHLAPWLHGNLVLVNMEFNFESQLDDMLGRFSSGEFAEYANFSPIFSILKSLFRWNQFLVVITTHSIPRTGDLHIAPNNTGSVPVNEVNFLFNH